MIIYIFSVDLSLYFRRIRKKRKFSFALFQKINKTGGRTRLPRSAKL
jgi:hypothetical protein